MVKLLVRTLKNLYRVLPGNYRRKSLIVVLSILLNSLFDILGLAALLPLFFLILDNNGLQNSQYLGWFFDLFGFQDERYMILVLCALIFLFVVFKNLMSLLLLRFQTGFAFHLQKEFSLQLFKKYHARGFLFFKETNSNDLVRDIHSVPMAFAVNVVAASFSMISEIVVLLFIITALVLYNPIIVALVLAIVLPAFWLFYSLTKKKIKEITEELHEISPVISKTMFESIFGYVDVKVTGSLKQFYNQYDELLKKATRINTLSNVFKLAPTKVIESAMILGIVTIISVGVFVYSDLSKLSTILGVFALAAYRILPSINRLMIAVINLRAYEYSFDVIDRIEWEFDEEKQSESPILFKKSIKIDQVVFRYKEDTENVLNGLTFELKRGETIGLVGKSGSGKSTLANILLTFLEPNSGKILVDEKEISIHEQKEWLKLIGYVQQEVYLIDGTLAENIAFGEKPEEIDQELLIKVIERASLKEVVDQLPLGVETKIGERGALLSGGQRQRIGIARALYSGAEILVFDEATSALDNETEKEVTDSIHKLHTENLTMIIIAHRITTLKYCDRILELEKGRFKKEHKYEDLIKTHL
ncbi:MAG: ATP-binding cassette domain-containing protein [Crocinitomicaceae bacterium]